MRRMTQKSLAAFLTVLIMLSAVSVSIFAVSEINQPVPPDAKRELVELPAVYGYASGEGCFVAKRTANQIKAYVDSHPFNSGGEATYEQMPDLNNSIIGKLSSETWNETLNALNIARYIAGLSEVALDSGYCELTQAASFVNCVNGQLSHYPEKPPTVSDEVYELGREGASHSNISYGLNRRAHPSESILWGYMEDGDAGNISVVGHRRWCLNPTMGKTGFGQVNKRVSSGEERYSAMYAFDRSNNSASEYNVAWPAQVMPAEYFFSDYPWSISTGRTVSDASVTLTRKSDGKVWTFSSTYADGYFNINNDGYGQKGCIIFRPDDVGSYNPGDVFSVKITGSDGLDISYNVEFFSFNATDGANIIASGCCGERNGPNLFWTLDSEGTLTISGNGKMIDTNSYYPSPFLEYSSQIKRVVLKSGVTSIGDYAFNDFTGLTEVTIPDSVTSIGEGAFYKCEGLTEVIIPNSVISIGDGAFQHCTGLTEVTIPDSVTNIGMGVFYSCTGLTRVTIPDSVTSIGDYTFNKCTGLTSVTIGNGVTSIGDYAFRDCKSLTGVTIPNCVVSIGVGVFYSCTGLTEVTIPNSVTSIGYWAFCFCDNLTDIYCEAESKPDGWNEEWCRGCSAKVHWGWNGSLLDIIASGYCGGEGDGTNLSWELNQGGTLTISGSGKMVDSSSSSPGSPFSEYSSWIERAVLKPGVTSIGDWAFGACYDLISVTIPDSVTSIGWCAFSGCYSLASFEVDSNNSSYCSIDGVLFSKDKTVIICYLAGKKDTSYSIPNSVTSIGDCAFVECTSLASVTIPNSVTSIGEGAFVYCTGLTEVTIPNSVTSIGDSAFEYCTGLISIVIPNSVEYMGNCVFWGLPGLKDIYCEAESKPDGWKNDWHSGCSAEIHWGWNGKTVYGDVNGDGEITSIDRVTLSRYLAGWEGYETINEAAADVNRDGKINSQDRVILSRHLAKWEGYETLPYIK